MENKKIIAIIDDDDIYQFAATKSINATNLAKRVNLFSDGQEALDYFKEHRDDPEKLPDLIFLDLNMPITDGWQFLEQYALLKPTFNKEIKIYMMSSSLNPDDLIQARNSTEVSDYIVKPIFSDKYHVLLR